MRELFDLSGKVALVTGGSRGLGREMVLGFARAGADVAIASRKRENCEAVAREVEALGRRAFVWPANVGRWDELDGLCDAVYRHFGRVDILVNNAGMSPVAPSLVGTSEALFDKIVDVNFKGPFRLASLIGTRMAAADGGSIINISSTGALRPYPEYAVYAASKAALNALTEALAKAFAPKVRVNTISPGQFLTDIAQHWPADKRDTTPGAIPRSGRPEEIVTAALYFASAASSYTTGALLRVDGGLP